MIYQVLARKWRPRSFIDVVGQEHVLLALENSLQNQRLHHAYLFSGTRGIGKTTIARLFAKGLNCEIGITKNPCNQCVNCLEIIHGRCIDFIEVDAASRTKVEDIREILDNIQYVPTRSRFKVYLIDEVHMLSRHSFDALLKMLEEPPEHVKFLLATTNPQKLPVTVLSRCLHFHLKTLDSDQISSHLERVLEAEEILSDESGRQLIAKAAEGSLRDALSLADQAIAVGEGKVLGESIRATLGILDDKQSIEIIEAIAISDCQKIMSLLNDIALRGSDWESVLVEMLSLLHRIAMIQLLPMQTEGAESQLEERLRFLARSITPTDLQLYYQILLVGRKELPYAPEKRMGVEMTLLRAIAFHPEHTNNVEASFVSSSSNRNKSIITGNDINSHGNALSVIEDKEQVIDVMQGKKNSTASDLELLKTKKLLKDEEEKKAIEEPSNSTASSQTKMLPVTSLLERSPFLSFLNRSSVIKKSHSIKRKVEKVIPESCIQEVLESERIPKLSKKIAFEAQFRDHWSSEIFQLKMPKLIEQFALNTYKELLNETEICLHLRSTKWHLNTISVHKELTRFLSKLYSRPIKLVIIKDDNPSIRTPLEWQQVIYEEKLVAARQSIFMDKTIGAFCALFDAQVDENSIQPM